VKGIICIVNILLEAEIESATNAVEGDIL